MSSEVPQPQQPISTAPQQWASVPQQPMPMTYGMPPHQQQYVGYNFGYPMPYFPQPQMMQFVSPPMTQAEKCAENSDVHPQVKEAMDRADELGHQRNKMHKIQSELMDQLTNLGKQLKELSKADDVPDEIIDTYEGNELADFYATDGFSTVNLGEYPEAMERFVNSSSANIQRCCCMPHSTYSNVGNERGQVISGGLFSWLGCLAERHNHTDEKAAKNCRACRRIVYDDIPLLS